MESQSLTIYNPSMFSLPPQQNSLQSASPTATSTTPRNHLGGVVASNLQPRYMIHVIYHGAEIHINALQQGTRGRSIPTAQANQLITVEVSL